MKLSMKLEFWLSMQYSTQITKRKCCIIKVILFSIDKIGKRPSTKSTPKKPTTQSPPGNTAGNSQVTRHF